MSTTEKLLSNIPRSNAKLFVENRETETMVALITDQNQRVMKDTPLVVEVRNGRAENNRESPKR